MTAVLHWLNALPSNEYAVILFVLTLAAFAIVCVVIRLLSTWGQARVYREKPRAAGLESERTRLTRVVQIGDRR